MSKKILVTPRSITKNGHPALDKFTKAGFKIIRSTPDVQPTEEQLLKLVPDCVGYLAGVEKISLKVIESAINLKAISRNGVGIDNIDLEAAKKFNVKILTTPGANARGVAELTLSHILSAIRSIPFSDSNLKNKNWQRRKGIELQDKTLGLIGCGSIGKIVAKLALGFDMRVLAFDLFKDESFRPSGNFRYCSLNEFFAQSDIISLHCPPGGNGKPLINSETISKMKDGVYIINTARAELLNDEAVLKALDEGKIAGITLDVFRSEPPVDWRLVEHPNVVATPHIGGFTKESVDRAVEAAVDNLLKELN